MKLSDRKCKMPDEFIDCDDSYSSVVIEGE